jgi:S-adenosylmethionine hydrolase
MPKPVITLTTDFGTKDPYVAEMKAVILNISPNATIIDITHQIDKFNMKMGAYILASASPFFPKGTIHVAVIDPRVGTQRRALCIQTKNATYLGPDNGVLALAAKTQGIKHVYEIINPKLMMPRISNTFHARDIFSPAAAHLANGTPPTELGPQTKKIATPKFAKVTKSKNILAGEVIHIDDFGNIITNIEKKHFQTIKPGKMIRLKIGNTSFKAKFSKTYAEGKAKEPLALIGSHSFLEISINQSNAAKTLKIKDEDRVLLYRPQN